jgi:hypothetical protein
MLSGEVRRSADSGSGDKFLADYFASELVDGRVGRS